ncbi:hypothetical protein BU26DRAFT_509572 [Trematosphaeria pertusa]|uniref:Uncharacterized protein n=1 Tax=Trematosphaeria pertusa TaxID=390896 RepID=A0A6A6I1A9_9PLEO|nr:uncharacterized protein BU26DRAFT_509572 [Trematosphaeria pertusa]KAF2243798.1 hypothetical protein BU26DRAFT_509572 [Trematosphaeria pertusa]
MSAYHNPDLAECYDPCVRFSFGDGPAQDVPIFEGNLQGIMLSRPADAKVNIVSIGTRSGRVPIHLLDIVKGNGDSEFTITGIMPSSAMLDRARRLWADALEKRRAHAKDHWVQSSATDFVDAVLEWRRGRSGYLCSVETRSGCCCLDPAGLHAFHRGRLFGQAFQRRACSQCFSARFPNYQGALRIPSVDYPSLVYVKHPMTEKLENGIRTESFRLDVENGYGHVLRHHGLSWDANMVGKGPGIIQSTRQG